MRYAICEECGLVAEAESADVGVGTVGHYHHCGVAHECSTDDLFDDKAVALHAATCACIATRVGRTSGSALCGSVRQ